MQEIDELNQLSTDEQIDIDKYFDDMDLPEEEKEERKEFAKEMRDCMLFIFSLFLLMKTYNHINKQYITKQLKERYSDITLRYTEIDDYLDEMINDSATEIIDTTYRHEEEEFFTSEERAILIACNSANDTLNYKQYADAIKSGKTKKRWITEKDKRVRKTHRAIDDKTIPIKDTFLVGKTLMRFPHDTYYGVDYSELSGCRCTIKYF